MRFNGLVVMASAFALVACGGGESGNNDSTIDTTGAAGQAPAGASTQAAAGGVQGAPGGTATMAPITGTTHTVKMVGDAQGYRFEPANLTVKVGDGVKFDMVSGGPHNVAFDQAAIPAASVAQLTANVPNAAAPLTSQMFMNPGESVTVSFANVAPGSYPYVCQPHLAMNMKGVITVQ